MMGMEMKRVIVTAAVMSLTATPCFAGKRENAMHHIAQVMAAASLCHRVEPQFGLISLAAVANGVDMQRDQSEMLADAMKQKVAMANIDEEVVCQTALALYGPSGKNVSGLLKEK